MKNSSLQSWRVLLVDDDEDDFCLVRDMLGEAQGRKIQLNWTPSYAEAQELLETQAYDAVLVDYDLGARSGIELIQETTQRGYPAPLILYTGRGNYRMDVEAMQAGATLYLTKSEANPLLLERVIRYAIEHKQMEAEKRQHLQERSEILESIQDGFFALDSGWRFTYVNRKAAGSVGKQPCELLGKDLWQTFPEILGTAHETHYRKAMRERLPLRFTVEGEPTQPAYDIRVYPRADGISVYWIDITEQRLAEQALRLSEERLRRACRAGRVGLYEWNTNQDRAYWSPEAYDLFGLEASAPANLEAWLGCLHPEDRQVVTHRLAETLERARGGQRDVPLLEQYRVVHGDGSVVWLEANTAFDLHGGELLLQGAVRDITERKRAEQVLKESEEKFRSAVAHAAIGFAMTTLDGRFIDVNPSYCKILGYRSAELKAMHFPQLIHPEDRAANMQLIERMTAGEIADFVIENRYVRKDGEPIWVRKSVSMVTGAAGAPRWIIALIEDITERKRAEQALRESEAREKARRAELEVIMDAAPAYIWNAHDAQANEISGNQALQDFALIASQDLKEPLRKVRALGRRLKTHSSAALDPQGQDDLQRMQSAAERVERRLEGLLEYARVTAQERPFVRVELAALVQAALADLQARIKASGGQVKVGELPAVTGDPAQLGLLMQNLIGNALKFHRRGVPPLVTITSRAASAEQIELTVEDNGIGFSDSQAEQLFRPFHRLVGRGKYAGAGMGLAICRKIVERHAGRIWARGVPGRGATFVMSLPVASGTVATGTVATGTVATGTVEPSAA